jgi:MoxR-like ATPase
LIPPPPPPLVSIQLDACFAEVAPNSVFFESLSVYWSTYAQLPPAAPVVDIPTLQATALRIYMSSTVTQYIRDVVASIRQHPHVAIGPSPTGLHVFQHATRIHAMLHGQAYVRPIDVDSVASGVLSHRLALRSNNRTSARQIVHNLVTRILVPPK